MKKRNITVLLSAIALVIILNTVKFEALAMESKQHFEKNDEVNISEIVSIPDANLKRMINFYLGQTEGYNPSKEDMEQLVQLNLSEQKITSLEGLEYAINLKTLYLENGCYWGSDEGNYNHIVDFNPISKLVNLEFLNLTGNKIQDLTPLKELVNLDILHLSNTNVNDLYPLSELTNLTRLFLSETNIDDITPLITLKNLTDLSLSYTNISDLEVLKYLTKLESVYLDGLGIKSLDCVKHLKNLYYLSLADNKLTSLEGIEVFTELRSLNINNNKLFNLDVLDNLKNLWSLYADNTGITNINFLSSISGISELSIRGNHIYDISLAHNVKGRVTADEQSIMLDPIYIKRGDTFILENALPGYVWADEPFYPNEGIQVDNGDFSRETNSIKWENIQTDNLIFNFASYFGYDRNPSIFSGVVTIPVKFYSVPEEFDKLVENDAITIVDGTGEAEAPLVLEVAQGTKKDVIEALIESYSGYKLTVSKVQTRSSVESYRLTFEKDEEKVYFEMKVHSSDEDIIKYLDNKVSSQPEVGKPEGTQPEVGKPEGTQPEGGKPEGTQPEDTKPVDETESDDLANNTADDQENTESLQHPETGFVGTTAVMGLGLASLGVLFTNRKKK